MSQTHGSDGETDGPTPRQDARATREYEQRAPANNVFGSVINELREQGYSWREVFEEMDAAYNAVDKAAYEEGFELIPEWRVAYRVSDPDTPSGYRYEYREAVGRDRDNVFERVESATGCPVVEEESEQIGYGRYS
jgi:hypothetical protein